MNLQPVYPARHPEFTAVCVDCHKPENSARLYADLDGEPFKAYHCAKCVFTFHLWSTNRMRDAEIDRDMRELKTYGSPHQ